MTTTTPPAIPLRRVAISTFENLALLLPEGDPEPGAPAPALTHGVRIAFSGPRCGLLEVRTVEAVAEAAARNMLADDAPTADLCGDALAEIANVICGNLVPTLAAPDDIYRLDAPRRSAGSDPLPVPDACALVMVEGGPVELRLALTPGPTA